MRIEVAIEGGFVSAPGLAKPVVLESADLPPVESEACEQLVREVVAETGAGKGPAPIQAFAQMPDGRRYRMKIEVGDRTVSLDASDMAMSPAFRKLLKLVRSHGAR
jgi:hypothetical protein